jgi:hypothetical protein
VESARFCKAGRVSRRAASEDVRLHICGDSCSLENEAEEIFRKHVSDETSAAVILRAAEVCARILRVINKLRCKHRELLRLSAIEELRTFECLTRLCAHYKTESEANYHQHNRAEECGAKTADMKPRNEGAGQQENDCVDYEEEQA